MYYNSDNSFAYAIYDALLATCICLQLLGAFLKKANRVIFIDSVGDVSMHTDLNSSEFWTRLNSLGISETDTALDQDENFAVSQNVALASQLMHKYKREDDTYRKLLWAYISCFPRSWFIMWSCFLSVAAVGVAIPGRYT